MFSYNVIGSESIRRSRKGMCSKKVAPSPLAGEGWDEGSIKQGVSFLPLTLALSRKGRGNFSDTLLRENGELSYSDQGKPLIQ